MRLSSSGGDRAGSVGWQVSRSSHNPPLSKLCGSQPGRRAKLLSHDQGRRPLGKPRPSHATTAITCAARQSPLVPARRGSLQCAPSWPRQWRLHSRLRPPGDTAPARDASMDGSARQAAPAPQQTCLPARRIPRGSPRRRRHVRGRASVGLRSPARPDSRPASPRCWPVAAQSSISTAHNQVGSFGKRVRYPTSVKIGIPIVIGKTICLTFGEDYNYWNLQIRRPE